jgi:hypothetical protein
MASDLNYWQPQHERRIGVVAEFEIIGIVAVGSYPPAVLIRHVRSRLACYFNLKSAANLQWFLALWIQEQAGKLHNG